MYKLNTIKLLQPSKVKVKAYPNFSSIKQLGVYLLHRIVIPSSKFAGTIYTPGWKEAL